MDPMDVHLRYNSLVEELKESYLCIVVIIVCLLLACSPNNGSGPASKPTELDKLPLMTKFIMVVVVGAVIFTIALIFHIHEM